MVTSATPNRQTHLLIEARETSQEQHQQCPICLEFILFNEIFYSHESEAHLAVHRPCLIEWISMRESQEPLTCFFCKDTIDYSNNQLFVSFKNNIDKVDKLANFLKGLEFELTGIITESHVYPLARGLRAFAPNARIDPNLWTPMLELHTQLASTELESNQERIPEDLRVLQQEYLPIRDAIVKLRNTALSLRKHQLIFFENAEKISPNHFPLSNKEEIALIPNSETINKQIIEQTIELVRALKGLRNNPLSEKYIKLINDLQNLIERTNLKEVVKNLSRFIEKIPEPSISSKLFSLFFPSILNGVLAAGIMLALQCTEIDIEKSALINLSFLTVLCHTAYFIKNTVGNEPLLYLVFFHLLLQGFDYYAHVLALAAAESSEIAILIYFVVISLFLKHTKNRMLGIYSHKFLGDVKIVNISAQSLAFGVLAGRVAKVYPVPTTALYAMMSHLISHTNRIWVPLEGMY